MKRFSTTVVATATALSLAAAPAIAQENQPAAADATAVTADQPGNDAPAPANDETKPTNDETKPAKDDPATKGSGTGPLVGIITGLVAATATIAVIVASNPSGINKIVDILNAQFGLGLAHVPLPF